MTTITANEMTSTKAGKFEHLSLLVGNTPMLELTYTYQASTGKIYVKCEHYNLTGSIKDRMALYTLKKAYAEGKIKAGDRIVEATSGNTGIAFVLLDPKTEALLAPPQGADYEIANYKKFLTSGLNAFH